jgi:hypothetical protein
MAHFRKQQFPYLTDVVLFITVYSQNEDHLLGTDFLEDKTVISGCRHKKKIGKDESCLNVPNLFISIRILA